MLCISNTETEKSITDLHLTLWHGKSWPARNPEQRSEAAQKRYRGTCPNHSGLSVYFCMPWNCWQLS